MSEIRNGEEAILFVGPDAETAREQVEAPIIGAPTLQAALDRIQHEDICCVVSEYYIQDGDGIELISAVRDNYPTLPVILWTDEGSEAIASEAITTGVTDYIIQRDGEDGRGLEQVVTRATELSENRRSQSGGSNRADCTQSKDDVTHEQSEFQQLLDIAPIGITVVDSNSQLSYANNRAEEILSLPGDEITGRMFDCWEITDWQGEPIPAEQLPPRLAQVTGEAVYQAELAIKRPGRENKWLLVNSTPITDPNDDTASPRVLNVVQDVSERKRHEEHLKASERKFRAVFEEAFDAMVIADDNAKYVDVNPAACELFDLSRDALLGRSIDEFAPEDYDFEREWKEFNESDQDRGIFPLVRPDGEQRIVEFAATPDILPGRHLSVLRDVTEERRMEEELDEIFGRITDAVYGLDDEWRFTYLNDRAEKLLGRTEGDLRGKYVWDEFPDALERSYREHYERAMETQESVVFEEYSDAAGTWLEVHAYPSETGLSVYFQDITERKEREEELARYETLFEESSDVNVIVDSDGTFRQVTPSVANVFGYEPEELVGESGFGYLHPEDRAEAMEEFGKMVDTPDYEPTIEFRFEHGDGSWITVEAFARNLLEDPDIEGIVIYTRDVTDRKQRERKLEQYAAVVETVDDGIYAVDEDANFVMVNDAFCELTGYEREELLGSHATTIHDDEITPRAERLAAEVKDDEREAGAIEFDIHTKEGARIPAESRLKPFPLENCYGRCGVVRDVTDRKRREQELRDTTQQLEAIIEASPDPIVALNTDGTVDLWNPAAEQLFGYQAEEIVGSPLTTTAIVPDDEKDAFADRLERALAGHSFAGIEVQRETKDGERIDLRISTAPTRDPHGAITGLMAVIEDITEQKKHERELQEERQFINTALDTLPDIFYVVSPDGEFLRWNAELSASTGYTESEIEQMNALEFFDGEDTNRVQDFFEEIIDTGEATVEADLITKDGTAIPYASHGHRLTDADGELVGICGISRDISARKQRETELEAARERYQTLIETAPDPIFVADAETGEIVETNTAACALRKQPREEIIGLQQTELYPSDEAARYQVLFEQHVKQGGPLRQFSDSQLFVTTADGERVPVSINAQTVDIGDRTLVHGIFRDISEQKQYEATLEELNRASRDFIEAETDHEIAQITVDVATEILDVTGAAVYFYDDEHGVLTPASHSSSLESIIGDPPTFSPGSSIAWRVYANQEREVFDDVQMDDDVYNTGTPIRSELIIPLGEHGVFLSGNTDSGVYDDLAVELAEVLVATAETALDRIEWARELQERERDAQLQTQQLERVNQINEKIRLIIQAIIQAETRQEIEQAVCDHLLELDRVAFTWIGEFDHVAEEITPQAWAGSAHEYLETISLQTDGEGDEPATKAIQDREPTVVSNIAETVSQESWRQMALLNDFRSAISVPLLHDELQYGVLTLYGTQQSAFDELSSSVLAELGELVGYALNAVEQRETMHETGTTELTFQIPNTEDTFVTLASRLDRSLEIRNISARSAGSYLVHLLVREVDSEQFIDVASEFPVIDEIQTISESDSVLFELVVSGSCLVTAISDLTAIPHSIVISEEGSQLTVAVPQTRDVRSFIERFSDQYQDVTLVGRRDSEKMRPSRLSSLLDQLTTRQQEILKAAYYGGFFDQPRKSTGAEIADALGISQPAFSKQLRKSERNLLKPLYDPE